MDTVPTKFRSVLSHKVFKGRTKNGTTKWSTLKKYAQVKDVGNELNNSDQSSDDNGGEIIISIQQDRNVHIGPNTVKTRPDMYTQNREADDGKQEGYGNRYSNGNNFQMRPPPLNRQRPFRRPHPTNTNRFSNPQYPQRTRFNRPSNPNQPQYNNYRP